MQKFNLNDDVLIQITEYGWKQLAKRYEEGFVAHCIKSYEEIIGGEKWYRLQAHKVISFFGVLPMPSIPTPIRSNILIP